MHSSRLTQFNADIGRARDLVGMGQSIGQLTHGRVDSSDVYRASLVQAVASLDHYFHGVVLDRATDILLGRLPGGSATKVGLPFKAIGDILNAATPVEAELVARSNLAQRLSLETFQRPDDIGAALAMVGVPRVWSLAFPDADAAKTALSLVVRRRNRIVHQCDSDPLVLGSVTDLRDQDALDAITVVEETVRSIDVHC